MKRKRFFAFGAIFLALGLGLSFYLRPDRFFSDLSMNVSAEFIVHHHSPPQLFTVKDQIILKIPRSRVNEVQKVFAAQSYFKDVSKQLPHYYTDFCMGEELFFPPTCPAKFQARRFTTWDGERRRYNCRFLLNWDNADFAYLYLDSFSRISPNIH